MTDQPPADALDERRHLMSLAYRMMGTVSEAEDVVQETYLRWFRLSDEERAQIVSPAAWLTRVASRVALDALTSARARRETYIGQWLPEPVPSDLFAGSGAVAGAAATRGSVTAPQSSDDPLDRAALDESVGYALLVVLETMTPAERVAFVLHDVFAMPFPEIAEIVGRSPAAVRQLATSARRHVREHRGTPVPRAEHDEAVKAFLAASRSGDIRRLMSVLAPDVELRSDGGGVVSAARKPVVGVDHVARFLLGVLEKQPLLEFTEEPSADGLAYRMTIGDAVYGIANLRAENGLITDVWLSLNPAKLSSWAPGD